MWPSNQPVQAEVHEVPLGGDIQEALDLALPGDTVQLESGLYEFEFLSLRSDVALCGSPAPDGSSNAEPTTILMGHDPSRAITCASGRTELRDLVIQAPTGIGLFGTSYTGGLVQRCWFTDSRAAAALSKGTWEFESCRFLRNGPGGLLYEYPIGAVGLHIGLSGGNQHVTFRQCRFEDNQSNYAGGAINCMWSDLVVENCEFRRNRANKGSAVRCERSDNAAVVQGSQFEHNISTGGSGAIDAILLPSGHHIVECSFRSNYSTGSRADITGDLHPQDCTFNTCCTVDPATAAGHGNRWTHAYGEQLHAMCRDCRCDFNCNGDVGADDLGGLLGGWGSADPRFDIDEDGEVGAIDLGLMLVAWGDCR